MPALTVYCSSSESLDPRFHATAERVGRLLAERGVTLVYGGGGVGLMGAVARAARAANGRIVGVITERLLEREQGWDGCDELIVVETMRERKRLLVERADGFIVLPGGLGTYEEFFETLVGRLLEEHTKPLGIVNDHGYYDPMLAMIEHGIEQRFVKRAIWELMTVDTAAEPVIDWVLNPPPITIDPERHHPVGKA